MAIAEEKHVANEKRKKRKGGYTSRLPCCLRTPRCCTSRHCANKYMLTPRTANYCTTPALPHYAAACALLCASRLRRVLCLFTLFRTRRLFASFIACLHHSHCTKTLPHHARRLTPLRLTLLTLHSRMLITWCGGGNVDISGALGAARSK